MAKDMNRQFTQMAKTKKEKKCLDSYPKLSNTKISLIPIILARILKSSDIY